jgi:hypothetical protein
MNAFVLGLNFYWQMEEHWITWLLYSTCLVLLAFTIQMSYRCHFILYASEFVWNIPIMPTVNDSNESKNCTMALGLTQPLTEMSTRNFPGGKKRPRQPCRHVWAKCLKMWEPQPLTTLWASTACYRDKKNESKNSLLKGNIVNILKNSF